MTRFDFKSHSACAFEVQWSETQHNAATTIHLHKIPSQWEFLCFSLALASHLPISVRIIDIEIWNLTFYIEHFINNECDVSQLRCSPLFYEMMIDVSYIWQIKKTLAHAHAHRHINCVWFGYIAQWLERKPAHTRFDDCAIMLRCHIN